MSQKFLSDVTLSTVTGGSMLKVDANGKIVPAVDGTDYISTSGSQWTNTLNGIYYSDNVRIGTYQAGVIPSAKLHVFDYQTTTPKLLIEDGNTGDASMEFKISTQSYTMGIDNSDADKFVLAASTALGTTNVLEVATTGAAAFQNNVLVNGSLYTSGGALESKRDSYQLRLHRADGLDDDWRFYSWSSGLNIYPVSASTIFIGRDGATTDLNVYNGNLYVDGGNLGIGTTTPSSMLEVDGLHGTWMAHSYGMYFRNNSDTGYTRYIHARSNGALSIGRGLTTELTGTSPNRYFTTDKDQIHITSGGLVGIGTTSPSRRLHVAGNALISGGAGDATLTIEADTDNSGEEDNPNIILTQDGGAVTSEIGIVGSAGQIFTGSLQNAMYLNSRGAGMALQLGTTATTVTSAKLTIEAAGDVGIGTTAPSSLLHLYKSSATSSGSVGTTLLKLENYVGSDLNQQKTFVDFILRDDNNNETPQVRIGAEVGENSNADSQSKEGSGAFVVYTNNAESDSGDAGASLAERFRVDYQGNLKLSNYTAGLLKTDANGNVSLDTNTYLTSLPAHEHDARYYTETEMDTFLAGKLSTSGGSLSGALNVLYNDHANGTGWDKNLFIGTSDDLGLAGAFPTYVPSGSYGFFSHAYSDGVFIGSVPTTAGSSNYYATIAWGDDATEYFQFLYKGSQVARLDTVGRFYAYGGNSEEWNAAHGWGNHADEGYLTSYTETDTLATVVARGQETAQALVVTATDPGNPAAADGSARLSGYGLLGNRGVFYLTNGGGDVQIGKGSVHNANPVATFGDSITHHHPTVMEAALTVDQMEFELGGYQGLRYKDGADLKFKLGHNKPDNRFYIYNYNTGASALTVAGNSNIGIGTEDPQAMLNIDVGSGGTNGKVGLRIGATNNYPSLELGTYGAYGGMVKSYGNDIHYFAGHWNTIGQNATEDHSHYWYTSRASTADWSEVKMELNHNGDLIIPNGGIRTAGATTFDSTVHLNGAVNFNGVNGQNFTVNTDGDRIIWDFQRNGTRRMSFYHEADQETFNFLFQSGNNLQINGNRILTTADSSSFADGTTYQTYGTGNNGWLMPDYNNNASNFMRMYYDDGSREFRMYSYHGAAGEAKIALYDGTAFNTLSSTNIAQFKTAYGWGNHASAGYASATSLTTGLAGKADTSHKYHSFSNGQQYYDGYGQNNYLRLFTENAVFDNFRFRSYSNVQVSADGVNWDEYPLNLDNLFDGREETGINITHETKNFRFEINRSTGWPTTALFVIQSTWSNTSNHTGQVILETWDGSEWIQRDQWTYSNFQRGYNLHTTTQVHNGQNNMRVTILMDWTDISHNYIPLRRILLLSNYSGSTYDMKPFTWNYGRDVTFANNIYTTGGNSTQWDEAYGWGNHNTVGYLRAAATDFILDDGTTAISSLDSVSAASSKYRWNVNTAGRPAVSQANEYGTALNLNYDGTYSTQWAHDIQENNLWIRTLNTSTNTGVAWKRVVTTSDSIGVLDGYTQSEVDDLIDTAIDGLIDSAPGTLDTLNELAAALGDDPNFATTVTNSIATKLPLSGGTMTGDLQWDTSAATTNTHAKITFGQSPNPDGSLNGLAQVANYGADGYGLLLHVGYGESDNGGIKITDDGVIVWGASDENVFTVIDEDSRTERFRIDNSGNITASGTLTASGYNKSNWDTAYTTTQSLGSAAFTSANDYLAAGGKAADANLLDGIDSTAFLRSNTSDEFSGQSFKINGINLTFNTDNVARGSAYFRGGTDHLVLGLTNGNTLYLNYGNSSGSLRTYGNWYHGDTQILSSSRTLTNVAANASIITAGTLDTARLSGTYNINVSGESARLASDDNRTISPSEDSNDSMSFGFTSWNNNNTSPYADYLHLRSYVDSSGGKDNLIMFKKAGIGMRIWQQDYGSATSYSNYVDVWTSGDFTSTNVSNWDTAFGWGNHASAGYAVANTLGSLALEDSVTISEVDGLQTALNGKLSTSGGTMTGTLRLSWKWSSTDLTANSFYVKGNSDQDGFAFGVGTGISSWFSWDNVAGQKRAIDVWNNGSKILLGSGGHDTEISNNLYVPNHIFHTGDTDTYMQFHANNQWRVVTGGAERLEVQNGSVNVQNDFKVAGSYTELGNAIGSVSNDGSWNARLNVAGTQHARLDVISVSDGIVTTTYSHTGQGMGKMGTISNHPLGLMTAGGQKVMLGTGGNMYPVTDRTQLLGLDTNRWQVVFCEILDSAGLHEKNLQNPEGEKSVGDYATGTVLVWKGGKNIPCTTPADHMRMGIAVKGVSSPLVQGAEPVLCTGEVNEGDYLVTSSVEGHAAAISPQYMRQHNLFDCVLGKALESAEGESHLVKTWINI